MAEVNIFEEIVVQQGKEVNSAYEAGYRFGYIMGRTDEVLDKPRDWDNIPECICGTDIDFNLQYCRNCDKKLFPF